MTTTRPTVNVAGRTLTSPHARPYTHVVVRLHDNYVSVQGWCGTLKNAEKIARRESSPTAPHGIRAYGGANGRYAHLYIQPLPGKYVIVDVETGDQITYATIETQEVGA